MSLIKLFRSTKYDLAISVAEEDILVAKKIAEALREKKVKYYLYTEHLHLGQHVLDVTIDVYGNNARYVLLITSKVFREKYWANLERMVCMHYSGKTNPQVFQLKLDEAEIEGIEKYIIYKKWEDNASEIAGIIQQRIKIDWWSRFKRRVLVSLIFLMCTIILIYWSDKVEMNFVREHEIKNAIPRNSIELNKKVLIPGVTFPIGYSGKESMSQRTVTIDSFLISPTEVTVEQYQAYCKSQGVFMPPQPFNKNCVECPVVNVTWQDAMAYCRWKNNGRLPTEAEWEYAADAGAGHKYSGSNGANDHAVYNRAAPYPVGTKLPNTFNLFDMSGNVSEWCNDWFDSTYYSALNSPKDNPQGPIKGKERVVRGGSFNSTITANTLYVLCRTKEFPDQRKSYIGFRVVWDK